MWVSHIIGGGRSSSLTLAPEREESDAKMKNEIKTKLASVFESDAKTKYEVQIRFSMSCEKEKWKWNLNSIFPCHRKTVGTKVHEFSICNPFQINYLFCSHTNGI